MPHRRKHRRYTQYLKVFRDLHRSFGVLFFMFMIIISITGLFLGWKKDTGALMMPKTQQGVSRSLSDWMPLEHLQKQASQALYGQGVDSLVVQLDRIDVRPEKGVAKFRFEPGHWEVQLDGANAQVLSIGKRYADLIEKIHDGSWVEDTLGIPYFKLGYMTITSLVLLFFSISGFWLWYGPKYLRRLLQLRREQQI